MRGMSSLHLPKRSSDREYTCIHMEVDYVTQGKKNRRKGQDFEYKVRKDLNKHYHIVRFCNNVDIDSKNFVVAKSTRFRSNTHGFPDFMTFSPHLVGFVECKSNGTLSKEEKIKCQIIKDMGFRVRVAWNNNGKIEYREFVEYKRPD